MKTKVQLLLLFLISISLFSCNNVVKNPTTVISNMDTDFPVTEKLEFKPFNTYDILKEGHYMIDDSILWFFERQSSELGSCYNLHTAERLSTIGMKGRAANEIISLIEYKIVGDSIQLYADMNTIKTFAKKDIIDNVPMGDRKFSVTTAPDSIWVRQMVKLPNGSVLATINVPAFKDQVINDINQKSVALFNDKEANSYETINYESFENNGVEGTDGEMSTSEKIKGAYASGSIDIKGNDMAVFSTYDRFILYTFDIKNGNVVNEKRYAKTPRIGEERNLIDIDDHDLSIGYIKTNDKYILCSVRGYFSEEDKASDLQKRVILVFDWKLNPIKKFDLTKEKNAYYVISNDCSAVYRGEFTEDGLVLDKADLNL